jgi:hypothetical protein
MRQDKSEDVRYTNSTSTTPNAQQPMLELQPPPVLQLLCGSSLGVPPSVPHCQSHTGLHSHSCFPLILPAAKQVAVSPGLMFAIIPLVFLSAVLVVILVLYAFRLALSVASPPYEGAPPPSLLPLRLHRTRTAPHDLELGSRSRELGQRTDLDARSAALWARSMLANPPTPEECATSPSLKIVPVKQAVVVLQPDG